MVSNLAEDDVLAIEPASDDGGNEELGAVAAKTISVSTELQLNSMISYVLGPALAIDRSPGLVCLRVKFSSANFSP